MFLDKCRASGARAHLGNHTQPSRAGLSSATPPALVVSESGYMRVRIRRRRAKAENVSSVPHASPVFVQSSSPVFDYFKQHFLCFLPLPHGQGSLRPTRLERLVCSLDLLRFPRPGSSRAALSKVAFGSQGWSRLTPNLTTCFVDRQIPNHLFALCLYLRNAQWPWRRTRALLIGPSL